MRQGLSVVAETWEREGKIARPQVVPDEFAINSGRIGGANNLATMGGSLLVKQHKGRWSSNTLMTTYDNL